MKEKVSVLLKYELEDHAGPEIPMAIFAATWNEPANIKLQKKKKTRTKKSQRHDGGYVRDEDNDRAP